jgi:hypothetical protein
MMITIAEHGWSHSLPSSARRDGIVDADQFLAYGSLIC